MLTTAVSLHRTGEAVVAAPGGCAIGPRPVDFHLNVLRAFGARDDHRDGMIHLQADRLRGARIELPFPSVGATEQFLFAAGAGRGRLPSWPTRPSSPRSSTSSRCCRRWAR